MQPNTALLSRLKPKRNRLKGRPLGLCSIFRPGPQTAGVSDSSSQSRNSVNSVPASVKRQKERKKVARRPGKRKREKRRKKEKREKQRTSHAYGSITVHRCVGEHDAPRRRPVSDDEASPELALASPKASR